MKIFRYIFINEKERGRPVRQRFPCQGRAFLAVWLVALFALGFGGCKNKSQEQSAEPPGLPEPLEQKQAPPPAAQPTPTQVPSGEPTGVGTSPAPGSQNPGGSKTGSVPQVEIEAFANVQVRFAPLQQQLAQKAQAGASQEQLQQMEGQLQQQAEQIIQSSTLSPERYNEIAMKVQRDPDLQRRVRTAIEQKTGGR